MPHNSLHFYDEYDIEEGLAAYAEIADLDRTPDSVPARLHRRPAPGQLGGVAVQLSFRDRLSDHPRLFDPDSLPDPAGGDRGIDNYERVLGRAVLEGEISAEEALEALDRHAAWDAYLEAVGGLDG